MLEPLSIVTAVTGFLGFSVAIRNSIFTIRSDVDAVKTNAESQIPKATRLSVIIQRVSNWRKLWNAHDGMPSELFDLFWGSEGSREILQLLTLLYAKIGELSHDFARLNAKQRSFDASNKQYEARAAFVYNEREERVKLAEARRVHKQTNRLYQRVERSVFQEPLFEKHLKELEDWTRLLEDSSEKYFISQANSEEADWKSQLFGVSMGFFLLEVADHSSDASVSLRDTLEDTGTCTVDLHLDHMIKAARRMEVLQEAACKRCFQYHFSVRRNQRDACVGFRCRVAVDPGSEMIFEQTHKSFTTVTEELFEREGFKNSSPLQMNVNNMAFTVQKLSNNISSTYQPQCLRSFMASEKTDFEKTLHGLFKKEERHRLAYELAEWALIFLKTNWFTNLCSCCVYRIETDDLRTYFRVRVAKVEHK